MATPAQQSSPATALLVNNNANNTNVSEETSLIAFYNELSSLVQSIPKHKVFLIDGNMNVSTGKNVNNRFGLHFVKQIWGISTRFHARK